MQTGTIAKNLLVPSLSPTSLILATYYGDFISRDGLWLWLGLDIKLSP